MISSIYLICLKSVNRACVTALSKVYRTREDGNIYAPEDAVKPACMAYRGAAMCWGWGAGGRAACDAGTDAWG